MENETHKEEEVKNEETQEEGATVAETEDHGHDEIKETEDFKDKYYYVIAEMQNMQKRFDREKTNLLKFGSENILKDLLEVVDNFERTMGFISNSEDQNIKNIAIGIEMIQKQLLETLEKHGLKQVKALGEVFDPNFHEAMGTEEVEGAKDEEIVKVHQNGYSLNERLVRPAKVVIAKN